MAARKLSPSTLRKLSPALLAWYDAHARDLPWRVRPAEGKSGERVDPYRVWLSEIMLQQTTVATVRTRFADFLDRWPSVEALAAAPLEDVLAAWAGLGYYARARNLHKCARAVAEDYGGLFPDEEEALGALPGVGAYTAAAIAAIAFDRPAVVVDGNVERVTARIFAIETPMPAAKKDLREKASSFWPATRSGDFAQGLMDLGATVCTPRNPQCGACPIASGCAGLQTGAPEIYPKRAAKKKRPTRRGAAFVLTRPDGSVLLRRREEKGLLGGMLEVATTPWTEEFPAEPLRHAPAAAEWERTPIRVVHTFTHFHLELDVFRARLGARAAANIEGLWTKEPEKAGLPTVMRKVVEAAR